MRVALPCGDTSVLRHAGKAGRKLIETLGRRWVGRKSSDSPSVREELGRRFEQGFRWRTLEGKNPGEHPAAGTTNPLLVRQGLSKGSRPRNRSLFGPAQRFRDGSTDRRNGRWVHLEGNASGTFREEKAPKGESHERRRCETKPARDRRA